MEYVALNLRGMAIRATLLVAFFVSGVANSNILTQADIDFSQLPNFPPDAVTELICITTANPPDQLGTAENISDCDLSAAWEIYKSKQVDGYLEGNYRDVTVYNQTQIMVTYNYCSSNSWLYDDSGKRYCLNQDYSFQKTNFSILKTEGSKTVFKCAPEDHPEFSYQKDFDDDGSPDMCLRPGDVVAAREDFFKKKNKEVYCSQLILDSGNNSSPIMCYNAANGNSCRVALQSSVGSSPSGATEYSYYTGIQDEEAGCSGSQYPPFDNQGIGSDSDNCLTSAGETFCEADRVKHCTIDSFAIETCDEGCLELNGIFMCDPTRHPDVGEGDSDYFDPKGTCSVVAGSAYRGACEELGGVWDKSGDYQDTSCPPTSISGTCSVSTNGGCFACLDSGGTWTPDNTSPLTNTEKGIQDVATLSQETNDNLKVLDNSLRKGNDSIISTLKSTNEKIVSELKVLNGGGSGGISAVIDKLDELKEEKETFTTTTNTPNSSLINSLFSQQKIAELKASSEVMKTDIQNYITSGKNELTSSLSITVPGSSGYQSRTVQLFGSSFDLSISRLSQFFTLLAGPIMFLCSVIALFIVLGRK